MCALTACAESQGDEMMEAVRLAIEASKMTWEDEAIDPDLDWRVAWPVLDGPD